MGHLTDAQAQTMPPSQHQNEIIPDISRVVKDDSAIALAVSKVMDRPLFTSLDNTMKVLTGRKNDQWVIIGDVVYVTNPLDNSAVQNASQKARDGGIKSPKLGVISISNLEEIRAANSTISTEDGAADGETQQKESARNEIDKILSEATGLGASDIHLQPLAGNKIQIRYRIDGDLQSFRSYKEELHKSIVRLLVEDKCNLVINANLPQDGKFDYDISSSRKINIRFSSLPIVVGSHKTTKVVMRLLGGNNKLASIDKFGLSQHNLEMLYRFSAYPSGLIIVTGPTGSGKTTTLHGVLVDMRGKQPNRNYHTIEEPVEIQHEGVGHTECGEHLSFADALRSLLRQDPDVLLVGEMRDDETAELGYKGSQTGHIVLSTLHTNNAHASIDRLLRMNIPADIIASNTTAIAAQRLVRGLCEHCKTPYLLRDDPVRFERYGSHNAFKGKGDSRVFKANPEGCHHCKPKNGPPSGLKGRRNIMEILEFNAEVQEKILSGLSTTLLRRQQIVTGEFQDLWDDGLRLVAEGSIGFDQLELVLTPYLTDRNAVKKAVPQTKPTEATATQVVILPKL